MTLHSQNGWSLSPPMVTYVLSPGVFLTTRTGVAGQLLRWAAVQWDAHVEPVLPGQAQCYNRRLIRGSVRTWSNHASATAVDLNPRLHPAGTRPSPGLVAQVHQSIVKPAGGLLRWGGDYVHAPSDPMHLEVMADGTEICALLRHLDWPLLSGQAA